MVALFGIAFSAFVYVLGLTVYDELALRKKRRKFHWSCSHCGTIAESATIAGIEEGKRIHDQAIYCPGDEDDYREHFRTAP
jgi:phage terminase large subunit GpA-like protein